MLGFKPDLALVNVDEEEEEGGEMGLARVIGATGCGIRLEVTVDWLSWMWLSIVRNTSCPCPAVSIPPTPCPARDSITSGLTSDSA
jgi:hypothetical protein